MSESSWRERMPWKINYPDKSVFEYFLEISKGFDDNKILFKEGSRDYKTKDIIEMTNKLAYFLDASSIEKDETVAILLPNSIGIVISIFASFQVGAKVTLINTRLSQREIAFQLRDSESKALITDFSFCDRVSEIVSQYQFKAKILVSDPEESGEDITLSQDSDLVLLSSILSKEEKLTEIRSKASDLAFLLYTGGTTGSAKAVMLTHSNVLANALQFNEWAKEIPQEFTGCVVSALPICHSFGLQCSFLAPLFRGEMIVIIPKFDPKSLLKLMAEEKATSFYGVPTMYIALLRLKIEGYDLKSLKVCVSGGSALPKEVHEEFRKKTSVEITEGYGLTECSPVTHINPYGKAIVNSIGKPLIDTLARLVDSETLDEVEEGKVGEIVILGPQVMKGYFGKGLESSNVFTSDGWLKTGDLARIDSEGYFFIVDRSKDVINSGGLKVYPREVEEELYKHPGVSLATVIPVPDDYFGEVGKAFIVAKEGQKITEDEMREFCIKQSITKYKIPKTFEFVDSLPLSAAGKVLKRELIKRESK